jgi:hypothetical protein
MCQLPINRPLVLPEWRLKNKFYQKGQFHPQLIFKENQIHLTDKNNQITPISMIVMQMGKKHTLSKIKIHLLDSGLMASHMDMGCIHSITKKSNIEEDLVMEKCMELAHCKDWFKKESLK